MTPIAPDETGNLHPSCMTKHTPEELERMISEHVELRALAFKRRQRK